MNNPQ